MHDGHDDVVRRLAAACRSGTVAALLTVLDADAVARCDGGGLVAVPLNPVHGADEVARLITTVLCGQSGTELTVEAVNGLAGLALWRSGRAVAVACVATADAKITDFWIVLNPAKLRRWCLR
jgi:RNA polymerase sigma-70 factor (ECF subfamily)